MEALVPGSALGAAFELLFKSVLDASTKVIRFDKNLSRLKSTLEYIQHSLGDIDNLNRILDRTPGETERLAEKLRKGVNLVHKCSDVKLNVFRRYYYSKKIGNLESELEKFYQIEVATLQLVDGKRTSVGVSQLQKQVNELTEQLRSSAINRRGENFSQFVGWSCKPAAPEVVVGLEEPVVELVRMVVDEAQTVVVASAPGGCGKTTLAKKICHEPQITGLFGDNIFFVTVSRTPPKLIIIVQKIFQTITTSQQVPNFQSDEDAINQLEQLFQRVIGLKPVLLVLDDVWSKSSGHDSLIDKLILNRPMFKILVTSRCVFPRFTTYRLNPLSFEQSVELFLQFAFDGGNCCVSRDLMNKVVKLCGGFPLALKVVGRSLYRQPEIAWKSRVNKWCNGESIFSSSSDLLSCLEWSLVALDEMPILKEFYFDLGLFPEDQKIPVSALLGMWEELYNLDEEEALNYIYELSNRNLVDLICDRKGTDDDTGYCNEKFAVQHDLLRDLAIHQIGRECIEYRKRIVLDVKENKFPNWWSDPKHEPSHAQIMSISTDETSIISDWQLPEVEVLILNTPASVYSLPHFISTMQRLKVLILSNNGSCPGEMHNFPLPDHLPNLKTIRLEHITISSSLGSSLLKLKNLRKLSLVMCEIGESLQNCRTCPNLVEIQIDYCSDLVELPLWFCRLPRLKKLAICRCPELVRLPEELGSLTDLEVLRINSCTRLQELPKSIGSLCNLKLFDLSDCVGIEWLPEEMGRLRCLKKLDMRGCLGLSELPPSVVNLLQLEHVVCDEESACLWGYHNSGWSNLRISVIKEDKNLNWLHNI